MHANILLLQSCDSQGTLTKERCPPTVKDVFYDELVVPLLNIAVELVAFRMSWPQDLDAVSQANTWKHLLSHHIAFDLILNSLPGVEGFISATSTLGADTPGIACFVMCDAHFSQRALCENIKSHFPETSVKFLLQPFQNKKSVIAALDTVLKDNGNQAKRMRLHSTFTDKTCDPKAFSLVHFSATKEPERSILRNTAMGLKDYDFPIYMFQWKNKDNI